VDTGSVEVVARAPVSVAPHLSEGMAVVLREDEREFPGRIRTVVPVGDQRSRMFEIRVVPEEGDWLIGSAVRVALPSSAPRDVIAVPRDALVLRRDSTFVFRVTEEEKAERVEVETGIGEGELIEVTGEVAAGDRVVVRGGERLREGQMVSIAE
jgi:RND family efflux transporter MFP subunit